MRSDLPAEPTTADVTASDADSQDCVALECLVLEGCHALEAFRADPCERHVEQVADVHAGLLAAAARADAGLCDDLLGVAGELEQALAAAAHMPAESVSSQRRGAA